jgi:hypothetical protein
MTLTFPPGVELMTDVSPAAWAEERLMARPFATAGAILPDAFESYARILHPAYRRLEDGREEAVTWATVASWTGRVAHPLMQFERIAGLGTDPNEQPDWGRRPEVGEELTGLREPLVRVLAELTTTREVCWICLWEGFGGLDLIPGFDDLARVRGPGRQSLLFRGPIDVMTAGTDYPDLGWPDYPQLWWPDDRAWCVATDIDLDSTYVGASEEGVARLLAEPGLEVVPAGIDDRLDGEADALNE